jgi:hypothetical protein
MDEMDEKNSDTLLYLSLILFTFPYQYFTLPHVVRADSEDSPRTVRAVRI